MKMSQIFSVILYGLLQKIWKRKLRNNIFYVLLFISPHCQSYEVILGFKMFFYLFTTILKKLEEVLIKIIVFRDNIRPYILYYL